ncbi:NAD(P)H-hydrate dehydratase [uncultured Sunxiuqinia sp.]|uniref:NAD(P)H-hydrate dehydratase n=1 Tax=uncultured Sunxiuqinia sp. TaxID=1573825 RepID=UPI002AA67F85|nr:NAD(P)H-hydrate dehydratase [uncultured Sunxiuqinia sp.]
MKLFVTKQIAAIDQFTIQNEPIPGIDLMERASLEIANWLIHHISNEKKLIVFAGPGNNGGDALAIARLMAKHNYLCELYLLNFGKDLTGSPAENWDRLINQDKVRLTVIQEKDLIPDIPAESVVLDGLFGSGLSRKLEGLPLQIVQKINASKAKVVAIDIPSGLFGEDNSENDLKNMVHADYTLTFQFPKLSFFFPEHEKILGEWEVLPIGLHPDAISQTESPLHYLTEQEIAKSLVDRDKFSHKGTYGHALLIAGSYGKIGAAVLASKACLRSGVGLLTTHIPHTGYQIMQTTVPEAMCCIDPSDLMFTEFPKLDQFSAVGVGPGLGLKPNSQRGLKELLEAKPDKLVLDADALNILSMKPEWLRLLPEDSILTPHPKEFERLAGATIDSYSRLQAQLSFSAKYKVIVVLKGAQTCITTPSGEVYFNTSGNPGMATAGTGDTLTGILLGLLAQNYTPLETAQLGVFIHGLAGDLAAQEVGEVSLIAEDLIQHLGKAFLKLKK